MNEMLHIFKENVQTTQDRPRFYADQDRRPRAFTIGQKVFCVSLLILRHYLRASALS